MADRSSLRPPWLMRVARACMKHTAWSTKNDCGTEASGVLALKPQRWPSKARPRPCLQQQPAAAHSSCRATPSCPARPPAAAAPPLPSAWSRLRRSPRSSMPAALLGCTGSKRCERHGAAPYPGGRVNPLLVRNGGISVPTCQPTRPLLCASGCRTPHGPVLKPPIIRHHMPRPCSAACCRGVATPPTC